MQQEDEMIEEFDKHDLQEEMPEDNHAEPDFEWLPPLEEELHGYETTAGDEIQSDHSLSAPEILKKYWGYDTFRPKQEDIIQSALDGNDTLGLMPTGGGKSITFQVPALMREGLCLVITPLISLMKDQVDHLIDKGIKATAIHSGMYRDKIVTAMDNCIYGRYKFLYISPERLTSPLFLSRIEALNISMIVVDECHCICQWGYDFRPSYLSIAEVREQLPHAPVLALTATATPKVIDDIIMHLGFRPGYKIVSKSFFRSNISYSIRKCSGKEKMMLHILSKVPGAAIIYCRNRKLTREISKYLNENGVSSNYFHAGLTHIEKEMRQNRWMKGEVRVMVATNAFGMGIDKPDVRLVIHLMMPTSLEEYFQEAGRAGRDGQKSYAVALVEKGDDTKLKRRLSDEFPPKEYIFKVFDSVCNFLRIGEGEGLGHNYDFDLELFMRRFRMHPVHTLSAIKIMEAANFWTYNDDESRSRLRITVTRDELYRLKSHEYDALMRSVLRTYPGIFTDYVFIDEKVLAVKTAISAQEVYELLSYLSNRDIVHYIPKKKIPRLYFKIRREDTQYLYIPRTAYEDRKERMANRIGSVLGFITEDNICRSKLLLNYFGERSDKSCGMCDVCLKRSPAGIPNYVVNDVKDFIKNNIREAGETFEIKELCRKLDYPAPQVAQALEYLLAHQYEYILDGNVIAHR